MIRLVAIVVLACVLTTTTLGAIGVAVLLLFATGDRS